MQRLEEIMKRTRKSEVAETKVRVLQWEQVQGEARRLRKDI